MLQGLEGSPLQTNKQYTMGVSKNSGYLSSSFADLETDRREDGWLSDALQLISNKESRPTLELSHFSQTVVNIL